MRRAAAGCMVAWLLLVPVATAGAGQVTNVEPVFEALQVLGPSAPGASDVLVGEVYDANGEQDLAMLVLSVGGTGSQVQLGVLPSAEPLDFQDGWKAWDPIPADGRIFFAHQYTYAAGGPHVWWVEALDESGRGNGTLAVYACAGDDDIDDDGVPDACDPEVNGVGGDGSASRYRVQQNQPAPAAVLDLTPSDATGSLGDFLAPSKATLRSFEPGSVDGFQLDVTTRMAPPADPGGEVDKTDLMTRVASSAQTLVVDVVVEGTHDGRPIMKASEVLASLELRLSIPAQHFDANALTTEGATLHEYSLGAYVRSLPLGTPLEEDGAFVYDVLLEDFSSFVFEALPLAPAAAGAAGGGGGGGAAGGASGGTSGGSGGTGGSGGSGGSGGTGGGCPISDLLPGIRTCGMLAARDVATGPPDSLFHTIHVTRPQVGSTYFSYRLVDVPWVDATAVAAFELRAAVGSSEAAFSLRVPGSDGRPLVVLQDGRPLPSSQEPDLLHVRLAAPGVFLVVHDAQPPELAVDWPAFEAVASDNLPGVRLAWWIDGMAAGNDSRPDRLPLAGQGVEVAAIDVAGHEVRATYAAPLAQLASMGKVPVAWLALPLLLAGALAWRTRDLLHPWGQRVGQRIGRQAALLRAKR